MKDQRGYTSIELVVVLFYFLIILAGTAGWIINIVKLTRCNFEPSYKVEAIRAAGVLMPPVGAITGYMTLEDGK